MKKIVLSLLLALTLIPMMPFNIASATSSHEVPLGEIELAAGEEKTLAKCMVSASTCKLSSTMEAPIDCFKKPFSLSLYGDTIGGTLEGSFCDPNANEIQLPPASFSRFEPAATFFIKSNSDISNKVKSTLTLELGEDGCYDCTLSDGSKVSHGDCSAQANGASRLLAPIAALLGGLLLLF